VGHADCGRPYRVIYTSHVIAITFRPGAFETGNLTNSKLFALLPLGLSNKFRDARHIQLTYHLNPDAHCRKSRAVSGQPNIFSFHTLMAEQLEDPSTYYQQTDDLQSPYKRRFVTNSIKVLFHFLIFLSSSLQYILMNGMSEWRPMSRCRRRCLLGSCGRRVDIIERRFSLRSSWTSFPCVAGPGRSFRGCAGIEWLGGLRTRRLGTMKKTPVIRTPEAIDSLS